MYLGGNGFYWRIAFHPEKPGAIEMRRAESGTRTWIARPANTIELHRRDERDVAGQRLVLARLVGISFGSEASTSVLLPAQAGSFDPRAASSSKVWAPTRRSAISARSAAGRRAGARHRRSRLGTPPHTLVLASSRTTPTSI